MIDVQHCPVRGTLHQSLRACDHGNVTSLIGGKCWDRPTSLYTTHLKAMTTQHSISNFHGMAFKWVSSALIISSSWPLALSDSAKWESAILNAYARAHKKYLRGNFSCWHIMIMFILSLNWKLLKFISGRYNEHKQGVYSPTSSVDVVANRDSAMPSERSISSTSFCSVKILLSTSGCFFSSRAVSCSWTLSSPSIGRWNSPWIHRLYNYCNHNSVT